MQATTTIALAETSLFRRQCYVNGAWMDARSGAVMEVDNPATREVIGTVPAFGREETRAAIEAAGAAWSGWRSRPAKDRARLMRRWVRADDGAPGRPRGADDERAALADFIRSRGLTGAAPTRAYEPT